MVTELTDLEVDEVSLVRKGANAKKFLIFKSMEGDSIPKDEPAGADGAGATGAPVDVKKQIDDAIKKALEEERKGREEAIKKAVEDATKPLQTENAELKKSLDSEKGIRRTRELVDIAKSDYPNIGKPEETAMILKALEESNIPKETLDKITLTLKKAETMKAEAGMLLFKELGYTPRPEDANTPTSKLDELVKAKTAEIRKSADAPKDEQVLKALALIEVAKENPELAMEIQAEDRRMAALKAGMVVV